MSVKMAQWYERSASEPKPRVQFLAETPNIYFFALTFVLFCFVLSKLDIVKVINCFFFF